MMHGLKLDVTQTEQWERISFSSFFSKCSPLCSLLFATLVLNAKQQLFKRTLYSTSFLARHRATVLGRLSRRPRKRRRRPPLPSAWSCTTSTQLCPTPAFAASRMGRLPYRHRCRGGAAGCIASDGRGAVQRAAAGDVRRAHRLGGHQRGGGRCGKAAAAASS